MSSFKIFDIAGSALTAQSQRLNVVASNLANADSATGSDGAAYQAKQVVFEATPADKGRTSGVRVSTVITDPSPMKRVYEPKHPMADADGYVNMPNVHLVEEMVNRTAAWGAYKNSVKVMNAAKRRMRRALSLGKCRRQRRPDNDPSASRYTGYRRSPVGRRGPDAGRRSAAAVPHA